MIFIPKVTNNSNYNFLTIFYMLTAIKTTAEALYTYDSKVIELCNAAKELWTAQAKIVKDLIRRKYSTEDINDAVRYEELLYSDYDKLLTKIKQECGVSLLFALYVSEPINISNDIIKTIYYKTVQEQLVAKKYHSFNSVNKAILLEYGLNINFI